MKSARVAVPLMALALFAGCGTPTGSTAFQVDGQTTRISQVEDSAKGCAGIIQQDATMIKPQVANMLLMKELARGAAQATRVEITPAMRAEALKQLQGEPLLANPECAAAVNGFADYAALAQKLGKEKLSTAIKGLDVQVNPVFGTWDRDKGAFASSSGSLSMEDLGQGKVFGGQ
ncbi:MULTISPECIES: hypothetical protein [unclassified Luteococcus]|uniref:hypothetical protein n=1 Tax=unclassified Luteococcus TaxID=2639923 RepID=UPI00313B7E82